MIWSHGLAFGLYLVCSLASTAALVDFSVETNADHDPEIFKKYLGIFSAFFIIDVIGQVASELLLCQILW